MKRIIHFLPAFYLFFNITQVFAYIEDGVLSNLPSVRANGLGEISVVSAAKDPLAGFSNPAFLGLFATKNHLGYYQLSRSVDFYHDQSYSVKGTYTNPELLKLKNKW